MWLHGVRSGASDVEALGRDALMEDEVGAKCLTDLATLFAIATAVVAFERATGIAPSGRSGARGPSSAHSGSSSKQRSRAKSPESRPRTPKRDREVEVSLNVPELPAKSSKPSSGKSARGARDDAGKSARGARDDAAAKKPRSRRASPSRVQVRRITAI